MKTKTIILIVVGLVIAAVVWFLCRKKKTEAPKTDTAKKSTYSKATGNLLINQMVEFGKYVEKSPELKILVQNNSVKNQRGYDRELWEYVKQKFASHEGFIDAVNYFADDQQTFLRSVKQ